MKKKNSWARVSEMLSRLASVRIFQAASRLASSRTFPLKKCALSWVRVIAITFAFLLRVPNFRASSSVPFIVVHSYLSSPPSLEISSPGAPTVHPRFFRVTLG